MTELVVPLKTDGYHDYEMDFCLFEATTPVVLGVREPRIIMDNIDALFEVERSLPRPLSPRLPLFQLQYRNCRCVSFCVSPLALSNIVSPQCCIRGNNSQAAYPTSRPGPNI